MMNDIRKEQKAAGVGAMNEAARVAAYQEAIRRLDAEITSMTRRPGRPRAETAMPIPMRNARRKRKLSMSTEQRQGVFRSAAGSFLKDFILYHEPRLRDDIEGAIYLVRTEHTVDEVMARRAISKVARNFIARYGLDARDAKALEKFLARNKDAIKQALIDRVAWR